MALDKLEKRMISTNTFLVSCVVPFAFYISGKCQKVSYQGSKEGKAEGDDGDDKKVKEAEEEEEAEGDFQKGH